MTVAVGDAIPAAEWNTKFADTGWITITLAGGATAVSGKEPAYRVFCRVVYFRGKMSSTGASSTTKFTLPAEARPDLEREGLLRAGASSSTPYTIATTGVCTMTNSVSNVDLSTIAPYPAT